MRISRISTITLTSCLALTLPAFGQVHERFDGWCVSLENATLPELVQFLTTANRDKSNGRCITWAIHKLSAQRYEPAVSVLVRFLDFQRPRNPSEEIFHIGLSEELFPAEVALELIGKRALPEVLRAIEADSTSLAAREKAIAIWMELYKYDEHAKAIALLKQIDPEDEGTRQRLDWAVQKALTWCSPPEEAACREAASFGGGAAARQIRERPEIYSPCGILDLAQRDHAQVRAGMQRKDVEKYFERDRGLQLSSTTHYVYPECRYLHVDVEFELSEKSDSVFSPDDTVAVVSKLYVDYSAKP